MPKEAGGQIVIVEAYKVMTGMYEDGEMEELNL